MTHHFPSSSTGVFNKPRSAQPCFAKRATSELSERICLRQIANV